jgi:hypothetical protein
MYASHCFMVFSSDDSGLMAPSLKNCYLGSDPVHVLWNVGVTLVSNAQKDHSMLRYNCRIDPVQNSNIFVSPYIVEFDRCLQTHITHLQRHRYLQFSTVE